MQTHLSIELAKRFINNTAVQLEIVRGARA